MYVEWSPKLPAYIVNYLLHHLLNGWKQMCTFASDLRMHDSAIHVDLHLPKRELVK